MPTNYTKIAFGVISLLGLFLAAYFLRAPKKTPTLLAMPDHSQIQLTIGQKELTVEVVNTTASITQGLSGRAEIGSDGMLFVFTEKRIPQFWMKEMNFDLDLVWISGGQVISITPNVPHPAPATPLPELPHYLPPGAVDLVLEIPAGKAAGWSLRPGDAVSFASGNR